MLDKRLFEILIFFDLQEGLVVVQTLGQLVHQVHQGDDFGLFEAFAELMRVAEQDFHGRTQSLDLHFSVEAALVAPNAVKDSRNIVKLVLNFLQKQTLLEIIFVLEELRLVEGQRNGALADGLRKQRCHILLSLSVLLGAHA